MDVVQMLVDLGAGVNKADSMGRRVRERDGTWGGEGHKKLTPRDGSFVPQNHLSGQ